jgi:hypothetical protein
MPRYRIQLTKEEVSELQSFIRKGSHAAQSFKVAYILLNCDEGEYLDKATNEEISKILKVSDRTINRTKKRFIEEGLDAVLERRPTAREYDKKIDGDVEAHLIALCCSDSPRVILNGRCGYWQTRWLSSIILTAFLT